VLNTRPWLIATVAMTLFCQPIGIVGIYLIDRARNHARNGQLEQAREKLTWAIVAVIAGWTLIAIAAAVITVVIATGK